MSTCPQCGASAEGNFCATCGAPLERTTCPSCGAAAPPGARFCTSCGTALRGGAPGAGGSAPRGSEERIPWATLGWWAAGALMVILILLLVFPVINPGGGGGQQGGPMPPAQTAPFAGGGAGSGTPPDISQMTPREAADRLFNRVMEASEAGDSGQVAMFMPMALQAYEAARPLDADGRFHLSLLQRTNGDYQAALTTAEEGLEEAPDHLLLLAAAGAAAREIGDSARALEYYRRFVEVYPDERGTQRSGYPDHASLIPSLREEAESFVAGAGG